MREREREEEVERDEREEEERETKREFARRRDHRPQGWTVIDSHTLRPPSKPGLFLYVE